MKFTDCDSFDKKVGLLSEEDLEKLGWPDVDNGNRICISRLPELKDFVEKLNTNSVRFATGKTKKYHIATDLNADDLESDDEGSEIGRGTCVVNSIAFVNRMDYYLCDGDDNEEIFLEELDLYDEGELKERKEMWGEG